MKYAALPLLLCLVSAGVFAAPGDPPPSSNIAASPAAKLVFKNYGFSIMPLDEPATSGDNEVLRMYLSAGVVGVVKQPFTGTMEEYLARSRRDIEKTNGKVLASKVVGETMQLEYQGSPQGENQHFYQRAVLKAGTVFLTTGVIAGDKWKELGPKLKACVDSFEVPPTAKPAGKLLFKKQGFAIAPPEDPITDESATAMIMLLPAENGSSPSVNVRLIRYDNSIENYADQNRKGLVGAEAKILSDEITRGAWIVEFTRLVGGRTFHGYQRAVLKAGIVYLATAVAAEEPWKVAAPQLTACVNSLEILPGAKPAAVAVAPKPTTGTGGGPITKMNNGEIAFASTTAMQLWMVHTDDLPGAEEAFASLGACPAAKPIRVPAGAIWFVMPAGDTTVETLAAEVRARGIPGLGLALTKDGDLIHLKGLKALKTLALRNTNTTDAGMENLKDLKEVQWLDLTYTQVSDAGLAQLKDWKNLQTLILNNTQVNGSGLANLKNMAALRTLRLMDAPVTDAGLANLKDLKALQVLDLQNDNHNSRLTGVGITPLNSGITDAGIANLKDLKSLRALDLTGVPITDAGLAAIKDLTKLETLSLCRTKITDAGLVNLKKLQNLKLLGLYDTAISDKGIAELKKILPKTDILRQPHAIPRPE